MERKKKYSLFIIYKIPFITLCIKEGKKGKAINSQ